MVRTAATRFARLWRHVPLQDGRLLAGRWFEQDPAKQADDPANNQQELQSHELPKRQPCQTAQS